MRRCIVIFAIGVTALGQDAIVPPNVPLRVALDHRVRIKHVGDPIQGRLAEPVYLFDRVVLPAGSVLEGHISEIGGVPARRRLTALLSGNFTPPRDVRAQFDALLPGDGSRLSLHTSASRGTAHTVIAARRPKTEEERKSALQAARDRLAEKDRAVIQAFKAPGKLDRLKNHLLGMLPYHRQSWAAGTLFSSVLQEPLQLPAPAKTEAPPNSPGVVEPEAQVVRARLLTPMTSATARWGTPVEAVVIRPLFSKDRRLLIPEGSRLIGEVVEARPARRLHRNGKLHFVFRQLELRPGAVQGVQGDVEALEANFDSHLAIDSEGAARAASPKSRFLFPALAVAAAGLSLHQDYNAQGVPDPDIGGRAESGAVGLGLVGTLLAQTSRTFASTLAFTGAGFSVYTNFIARGENVVLPVNTPVEVSVRSRTGEGVDSKPAKQRRD